MAIEKTGEMATAHVRVLGAISIQGRAENAPTPITGATAILLAALVASRSYGISKDALAKLYWPTSRPSHWAGLLDLYERWLQQKLPAGWDISQLGDTRSLIVGEGTVDAWQLIEDPGTAPIAPRLLGEPYPGMTHRGVIAASAKDLRHLQRTASQLAGNLMDSQVACGVSHPQTTGLLQVFAERTCVLVNASNSAADLDSARRALGSEAHPGDQIIVGGLAAELAFGDIVVAIPELRWQLLEISGGSRRSRVARAWRVVHDHWKNESPPEQLRLIVFDAHLLDEDTAALIAQLIRYPSGLGVKTFVIGDAGDSRDAWQELRDQMVHASCERVARCPMCSQWFTPIPGSQQHFELCG